MNGPTFGLLKSVSSASFTSPVTSAVVCGAIVTPKKFLALTEWKAVLAV